MTQYSIAEARKNLPAVVDEALAGGEVRLTRHGREVAVLVSTAEYERLKRGKRGFREAYAEWQAGLSKEPYTEEDGPEIGPEYWDALTPPFRDGQIAATAYVHGLKVVTANVRDFHSISLASPSRTGPRLASNPAILPIPRSAGPFPRAAGS